MIWLKTDYYVTSKCTLSSRDGRIYIGGNNPASEDTRDRFVWCLDAVSGDVVWGPERISSAVYSASPLLADGKIYATSEQGLTTVIQAGPRFEILAENSVDEYTLASMAVADGQLFLRTADHLYCLESDPQR